MVQWSCPFSAPPLQRTAALSAPFGCSILFILLNKTCPPQRTAAFSAPFGCSQGGALTLTRLLYYASLVNIATYVYMLMIVVQVISRIGQIFQHKYILRLFQSSQFIYLHVYFLFHILTISGLYQHYLISQTIKFLL